MVSTNAVPAKVESAHGCCHHAARHGFGAGHDHIIVEVLSFFAI